MSKLRQLIMVDPPPPKRYPMHLLGYKEPLSKDEKLWALSENDSINIIADDP